MALKSGDIVGTYEVIGPLGAGGMASVLHARHTILGSDHALKVLRSDLVTNAEVRRRFLDEGRVQAQLRHPGIVRVTGIVSEPGVAGLVMDLLQGRSLEEELQRGSHAVDRAAGWMLQALDALAFAHDYGVVHRDLKPANLFLIDAEPDRTIKLLDFGIAKVTGQGQTQAGGTLGTYGFMAPEQLRDSSDVDARADVFALGAVLYELVTGQPAFRGTTDFELMQQVNQGTYDPGLLPEALRPILAKALDTERATRFQTAASFADALRPLARPEDRALVAAWDEQEAVEPTPFEEVLSRATIDAEVEPVASSAPPVETALTLVEVEPIEPAPRRELDERRDILVRTAGAAQIFTGALNTFLLWMLSCYGYPKVFGLLFTSLGLPGVFQHLSFCGGALGVGLLVIGPLEILAGVRAQMRGGDARGTVRRTATLQIAALAFGGVPSFLVGTLTTVLLLLNPEPEP